MLHVLGRLLSSDSKLVLRADGGRNVLKIALQFLENEWDETIYAVKQDLWNSLIPISDYSITETRYI